eukprot:TRINITY_DN1148_c0_g1_i1.p2 TRINITY_DN1148_c0_g1~~TRINITY_DN1148_c0_g1_i1.p2  ORF type:complete len:496 (+),score=96.52 TRINITY_DN1148_c0_g1_i1:2245-3732(+)
MSSLVSISEHSGIPQLKISREGWAVAGSLFLGAAGLATLYTIQCKKEWASEVDKKLQRDRTTALEWVTRITGLSIPEGIALLEANNWNVDVALDQVRAAYGLSAQQGDNVMTPSTNNNGGDSSGSVSSVVSSEAGGSGSSSGGGNQNPVGWVSFFKQILSSAGSIVPSVGPTPQERDPNLAAQTFIDSLGDLCGGDSGDGDGGLTHPNFAAVSYERALADAKRDLRMLLLYIHSDLHQDTPAFCRNVLSNRAVIDYMDNNFLCWGGSISYKEGFKVSNMLGAPTFPFIAIINPIGRVQVVERIQGIQTSEQLLNKLVSAIDNQSTALVAAQADRQEVTTNRTIREEQDVAYEESLRADQERERREREEREREEREERERVEAIRAEEEARAAKKSQRERELELKLGRIPPEPAAGEVDVVQIYVRLPNGERIGRRFRSTDRFQSLYDFVDTKQDEVEADTYELMTNFPRVVFRDVDEAISTGQFGKSALLMMGLK